MKHSNQAAKLFWLASACFSFNVLAGTTTFTYKYDDLGRLKSAKTSDTAGQEYEYDAADNRTKKTSMYSPIIMTSMTVKSTLSNGTAKYKLKADGTIEVTKTTSFVYAGRTHYYDTTSLDGRWLEAGVNSNGLVIEAVAAPTSGDTNCTSGAYGANIPGHYEPAWTMSAVSGYGVRSCRVWIKIRSSGNSTILSSVFISLRAGPNS